MNEEKKEVKQKKPNKFLRLLYNIFIGRMMFKMIAIFLGLLIWILAVGF